ncbi:hypothetical protein PF005_g3388 [Phytophthora fragariae]|uniref:Cytochrome P450 n=2 Tax=Phytophthora fragariae TaxID=53985 RepID=A0A6A3Z5V5_9STRA|nr:hypothetical protein PF003_g19577 [Phytophthora fragariae]KAE8946743.1 hypothetical protein PF009_g3633 [Phytophthora fragariae]KAE9010857.1 hypothetical protein PF011_g9651 [Phytophthora fragariae]KAE9112632.1 hypothetical protein PF010_g10390 [Phytophthora fragariae]KAE9133543.1 hypothetical protein PF007_g3306 [Phytophthora fragariae]
MWMAQQQALIYDVLLTAVSLAALYAVWRIASSVYSQRVVDAALAIQKLHTPPSTIPVLGNTLDALFFQKDRFWDWITEQSSLSRGKPWVLRLVGRPATLVCTSPETLEDIFRTHFDTFERGAELRDLLYDFFGEGIVGADGENWKMQRRAASHMFTTRALREVMEAVVKEKTLQLRDALTECSKEGRPVEMKSLLGKFSGDTFTKIAFGVDLNGLAGDVDAENDHPFNAAVEVMSEALGSRLLSPTLVWKLKRFLNVGDERKLKQACEVAHELTHQVMSESMQQKKSDKKDLLTLLVESNSDMDIAVVRDAAMNFLLAGKDSTTFSLSWIIVNLNRHPRVLAKLREEISTQLPGLVSGEIDVPTINDLYELPYLEAVVKESLRLHAIATTRVPNKSVTLSDGTFVPFGCAVMMPAYATARLKNVWGEDASDYKPERWIDPDTGKIKTVSPFKFGTFISGPRHCVGMRFALLEMRIATAVLFSRFDLTTVKDPFEITYEYAFTLPVKGPLDVTVRTLSDA